MSTKPGATISPVASIVRVAGSSTSPMATTRPSLIPTSPCRRALPVPSTTLPPTIFTSSMVTFFRCVSAPSICWSRYASWEVEQLRGLVRCRDGAVDVGGERDRLADELLVRRLARSCVVLEPDAHVAASLESGPGNAALEDVAAEHRDRPRHVAVAEQLEISVERGARRPEPEPGEEALVAAEVELHHCAGREAPRLPPREYAPQEPGLVDRDARSESVPRTQSELVRNVVERVRVDDPRCRESIGPEPAEVHRTGVAQREPHPARLGERGDVRVRRLDVGTGVGGRVEERVGPFRQRGSPPLEVPLGCSGPFDPERVDVVVHDGGAGGEAPQRVLGDLR